MTCRGTANILRALWESLLFAPEVFRFPSLFSEQYPHVRHLLTLPSHHPSEPRSAQASRRKGLVKVAHSKGLAQELSGKKSTRRSLELVTVISGI
ncbi:hypothetical protein AAFF_G00137500 [Aldrovandia affinis]|uniref:Uncharacterized protein n=1 Tax=Aldrovandia affinis TaxID=143900 RepID=A0AAD7TD85_9TELE|nr:hypothetical protein AAFF_G00137500 [Aldrovandia affinis]